MILPSKHTRIDQSLLGFGGYLLKAIGGGSSVDSLWMNYLKDYKKNKYKAKQSFDNLLLTLVFLFSIGAIEEKDGEVKLCN